MEHVNIEERYNVNIWSDSEGTQPKYYKDGFWYKIDCVGKEGVAEQLTSEVLSCSNVSNYVPYTQCIINGKTGCKSATFLNPGEHYVSFQHLYQNLCNENLAERIMTFSDIKERIDFVKSFIKKNTGLDCTRYLQDILAIDMLTRNPDRHFGNLGLILSPNGLFRLAPIFDNGQGLYQNFQITPPILSVEEKEYRLSAATFSGSFELQALTAGILLKIDYGQLLKKLSLYPDSIAKNCLLYQLDKYQKIFNIGYQPESPNFIPEK